MKRNSDRKRAYTKPTMRVYELQHQCHVLAGSNGDVGVQDYYWHNEDEE